MQTKMDYLRESGKRALTSLDTRRNDILHKWEDKSREFIHSFLDLFGRDGRVKQMWDESRGALLKALSPPPSPNAARGRGDDSSSDEDSDVVEVPPLKRRRIERALPVRIFDMFFFLEKISFIRFLRWN